jgi:hypothetical protein
VIIVFIATLGISACGTRAVETSQKVVTIQIAIAASCLRSASLKRDRTPDSPCARHRRMNGFSDR